MKNILNIICLMIFTSAIGQTLSLETIALCSFQNQTCPPVTYVKDINNSLNKYVGTWKGVDDGKTYEFNFIKKENVGEVRKWDKLIGRLKIINPSGDIEFDNFNKLDLETKFKGFNFQKDLKAYMMSFFGGQLGCIDYGFVYLRIKPETPDNMTISFLPDNDIVREDCSNFKTTLPTKKIISLTRQ